MDKYILMHAGSALGQGVGPLLVSKKEMAGNETIDDLSIALPGEHTTANLLFNFAYPGNRRKKYMIFSSIEDAVISEETDLGVIIHENRFTYRQRGLHKVRDLGEYWEEKMQSPIPLGGIVIKRSIERSIALQVDSLVKKSLEFAFNHYPLITDYVKQHSQAMSEEVMRKHIDLYVNDYSLDLEDKGRKAIKTLHAVFSSATGDKNAMDFDLFL